MNNDTVVGPNETRACVKQRKYHANI